MADERYYKNIRGTITPEQRERFRQAAADAEADHDPAASRDRYERTIAAANESTFSGELRSAILNTDRTHGFLLPTLLERSGVSWVTLEPFMLGESPLPSDAINRLMQTLNLHVLPVGAAHHESE